jgi:hypothetical protein
LPPDLSGYETWYIALKGRTNTKAGRENYSENNILNKRCEVKMGWGKLRNKYWVGA